MREGATIRSAFLSERTPPAQRVALLVLGLFLLTETSTAVFALSAPRYGTPPRTASVVSQGIDVIVNAPGDADEEGPNCNVQNEVSLARWGDNLVAGWNDGSQCQRLILRRSGQDDGLGLSVSGYGYSSDAGATWTDGGLLDPPAGASLEGDPVVAAGPSGVFYYATLYACASTPPCVGPEERLQVGVASSADGGRSWTLPVGASGGREGMDQDKPWIAVDATSSPHRGSVYVAWTEMRTATGLPQAVLFARSLDGGKTFSDPIKLSTPVPLAGTVKEWPGFGTQIAVGPEGEIYVGWVETQLNVARRIWFVRSLDGGNSFDPPTFVGEAGLVGHRHEACAALGADPGRYDPTNPQPPNWTRWVINGDIRIGNWLSMAVDVSPSPHRGNIYLAVPHDEAPQLNPPYGDESDIAFMYSKDGGASWTNVDSTDIRRPPTFIVNADETNDQFHPQVAVDTAGRVAVSWYDRRSDPGNLFMDLFVGVSTDGGRTFGQELAVSDDTFPPSRTNPSTGGFGGCYMGEYNAMVGGDGEFLLAWGDNRDGSEAHPDPNVYFDRVKLGAAT